MYPRIVVPALEAITLTELASIGQLVSNVSPPAMGIPSQDTATSSNATVITLSVAW